MCTFRENRLFANKVGATRALFFRLFCKIGVLIEFLIPEQFLQTKLDNCFHHNGLPLGTNDMNDIWGLPIFHTSSVVSIDFNCTSFIVSLCYTMNTLIRLVVALITKRRKYLLQNPGILVLSNGISPYVCYNEDWLYSLEWFKPSQKFAPESLKRLWVGFVYLLGSLKKLINNCISTSYFQWRATIFIHILYDWLKFIILNYSLYSER